MGSVSNYGFNSAEARRAWLSLMDAIDDAEPKSIPCRVRPDLFFLEDCETDKYTSYEANAIAKQACSGCPLRVQCAEYGIRFEDHGVWGGLSTPERMAIRKGR